MEINIVLTKSKLKEIVQYHLQIINDFPINKIEVINENSEVIAPVDE